MTFGDSKEFAIEVYHEPLGPRWNGFGRMALHVAGVTFGNLQECHCGLADAAERLRAVWQSLHEKWDASFSGHSDEDIFALIDRELYVDYGQTEAAISDGRQRYGRFDFLTNAGEQFDDVKTFIYVDQRELVHILYAHDARTPSAVVCSVGSFRSATADFLHWYSREVMA